MTEIIRTVRHSTKFMNVKKKHRYDLLLDDMAEHRNYIIDYLWNNEIDITTTKNNHYYFNILKNNLNVPSVLPCTKFKNGIFCTRMVSSLVTQSLAIIRSITEDRRKQWYVLKELQRSKENCSKLQSKIDSNPLTQPVVKTNSFELSNKNAVFVRNKDGSLFKTKKYDCFIKLWGLGKKYGIIIVPIKLTEMDKKFMEMGGDLLNSFLLTKDCIEFRYKMNIELKTVGITVGCDSGRNTLLSFSDRQQTTLDINKLINKKLQKKPGSKGRKKAEVEEKQLINKEVKSIDFSNFKQLNYEHILLQGLGMKTARWIYGYLENIVEMRCEMEGVLFVTHTSPYMSQRCSSCGWVCKANRKGKIFRCRHCNHADDADINSAINHSGHLYDLSGLFCSIKENKLSKIGFFWTPNGIYDKDGNCLMETIGSLASPLLKKVVV